MLLKLNGVLLDGSVPTADIEPAALETQDVAVPVGEDVTVRVTVSNEDLTAAALTGTAVLTIRKYERDAVATIARNGSIVGGNGIDFALAASDTQGFSVDHGYRYDVWLTDVAGKRWQLVPKSEWLALPAISLPSDTPTVVTPVSPLALGPSWISPADADTYQTDGATDEQVAQEFQVRCDEVTGALPNIYAAIAGILRVTGGTGTLRVRAGGTIGQPDGAALVTVGGLAGTSEASATGAATVVKPSGTVPVKVTLQNNTAGQRTVARGLSLLLRGAL